jgi:serine/threonine protein kinase
MGEETLHQLGSPDQLELTYQFTDDGAFNIQGFEIQETGITRAPAGNPLPGGHRSAGGASSKMRVTKNELIRLDLLGRGASSVVHEMLHVPALCLVAVKAIPCFEKSKRHQMIQELKALYVNLMPIQGPAATRPFSAAVGGSGGVVATTTAAAAAATTTATDEAISASASAASLAAFAEPAPALALAAAAGDSAAPSAPSEEQLPSSLHCPYIVALYDAFISPTEGNINMVMEYMDGGSLQEVVDSGGCECEEVLANIADSVCRALAFLHARHQIHRDIKPSNLLINHKGEVKLSDFGIVRDVSEGENLNANTFVGTMVYMSPERINGSSYSFASDVWSLGLSLMAVALGRFPLPTEGGYWGMLHALTHGAMPALPTERFSSEVVDFCNSCLHKDPARRPTAAQLLEHAFLRRARMSAAVHKVPDQSAYDGKGKLEEICVKVVEYKMQRLSRADVAPAVQAAAIANGGVGPGPGAAGAERAERAAGTAGTGGTGERSERPLSAYALHPPGAAEAERERPPSRKTVLKDKDRSSRSNLLMGHCSCPANGTQKCAFCKTASLGAEQLNAPQEIVVQQHTFIYIPKVAKRDCVLLADQIGLDTEYVRSRINAHIADANDYLRRARLYSAH